MRLATAPVIEAALSEARNTAVLASELPDSPRRIYAATYGEPPDPPATAALLVALAQAAAGWRSGAQTG